MKKSTSLEGPLKLARQALKAAIIEGENDVLAHIDEQARLGRTGGIEKAFSKQFHDRLSQIFPIQLEVKGSDIGVEQRIKGRQRALVDCFVPELEMAIEYKAVRMPRLKSELFDLGQLIGDYRRLANSGQNVRMAFVVVFAYGKVLQAMTKRRAYKELHNQLFVDFSSASKLNRDHLGDKGFVHAVRDLGWNQPYTDRNLPKHVFIAIGTQTTAVAFTAKFPV